MKQANVFFENAISITDLREDIDTLTDCLAEYPYAIIFKNRSPFFIAVDPEWFKTEVLGKEKGNLLDKRRKTVAYFKKIAKQTGDWQAAKTVVGFREKAKQKWTK